MGKNESIKLDNITVHCGVTKLVELIEAGYSVARKPCEYHEESQTAMYSFSRFDESMGMLIFYDLPELVDSTALTFRPIDLVLLENEPAIGKKSTAQFFNRIGIPLTKGNILMFGGLYLFCWLIILLCFIFDGQGGIEKLPAPFTYILLAFPPVFMTFVFAAYGLKLFFALLRRNMPFSIFVYSCIAMWLVWTYANALALVWLPSAGFWGGWAWLLPIVLAMLMGCFAGYHVRCYFILNAKRPIKKSVLFLYFLLHGSIFVLLILFAYLHTQLQFIPSVFLYNIESVGSRFCVLAVVQLFLYSEMTFFGNGIGRIKR